MNDFKVLKRCPTQLKGVLVGTNFLFLSPKKVTKKCGMPVGKGDQYKSYGTFYFKTSDGEYFLLCDYKAVMESGFNPKTMWSSNRKCSFYIFAPKSNQKIDEEKFINFITEKDKKMNKVIRLFLNTDMRNQHDGLRQIALKQKVDIASLGKGEHVVFINSRLNRVKVVSRGSVLSYMVKNQGRIDLGAFQDIAKAFGEDGSLNFDKALKARLEKSLRA